MSFVLTIASDDCPPSMGSSSSSSTSAPPTSSLAIPPCPDQPFPTSSSRDCSTAVVRSSPPSPSSNSSSSLYLPVPPPSPHSRYWTSSQVGWQLLASVRTLRVLALSQLSYNLAVFSLSIWALSLLWTDTQQPLPAVTLMSPHQAELCTLAFLISVVASALLTCKFVMVRWLRPDLTDRPILRRLYVLLRLWTGLAPVTSVAALCSMSAGVDGLSGPAEMVLYLLMLVTTAELVAAVALLLWYGLLHCVIPHSSLTLMPPFLVQHSSSPLSPRACAQHRRRVQARLRALPPVLYTREMRCEAQCIICVSELVEGERVRVFRCGHGYHAVCIDEWLVRRSVCPLCLQQVRLSRPKKDGEGEAGPAQVELSAVGRGEVAVAERSLDVMSALAI